MSQPEFGWIDSVEQDELSSFDDTTSWDEDSGMQVFFKMIFGGILFMCHIVSDCITSTVFKKQAQKGITTTAVADTNLLPKTINCLVAVACDTNIAVKRHINKMLIAIYGWLKSIEQDESYAVDENVSWDETANAQALFAIFWEVVAEYYKGTIAKSAAKITKTVDKRIATISMATSIIKRKLSLYRYIATTTVAKSTVRKYSIMDIEFIGSFKPGDVVKINSQTLEVTLNNTNALHLIVKSRFPIIRPGEQELIYEDSEGGRQVKITIQWKDKWV